MALSQPPQGKSGRMGFLPGLGERDHHLKNNFHNITLVHFSISTISHYRISTLNFYSLILHKNFVHIKIISDGF